MKKIEDKIQEDKVDFTAYQCLKCGEELMDMNQLKALAEKYRELRKAKEVTFAKWGNSLAVRIPKEFSEELAIREGDHAFLKRSERGMEIIAT